VRRSTLLLFEFYLLLSWSQGPLLRETGLTVVQIGARHALRRIVMDALGRLSVVAKHNQSLAELAVVVYPVPPRLRR
jgi:hypothetical protein